MKENEKCGKGKHIKDIIRVETQNLRRSLGFACYY